MQKDKKMTSSDRVDLHLFPSEWRVWGSFTCLSLGACCPIINSWSQLLSFHVKLPFTCRLVQSLNHVLCPYYYSSCHKHSHTHTCARTSALSFRLIILLLCFHPQTKTTGEYIPVCFHSPEDGMLFPPNQAPEQHD